MTLTLTAAVQQFANLSKSGVRHVLNESVQDVIEGAQTPQAPASQTGGSFETGKIPVDTKELIDSLHLGDDHIGQGEIGTIEAGTIQTFEWQATHAARTEYGFVGEDSLGRQYEQEGRFFVTENAAKFPERVEHHAKAKGGK